MNSEDEARLKEDSDMSSGSKKGESVLRSKPPNLRALLPTLAHLKINPCLERKTLLRAGSLPYNHAKQKDTDIAVSLCFGGDEGTRTPDLCVANASLYQLSHAPVASAL